MPKGQIPRPPVDARRVLCPRPSPRELQGAGRYFASDPETVSVVAPTFWECEADYNPLGQFGASFSSDLSVPGLPREDR